MDKRLRNKDRREKIEDEKDEEEKGKMKNKLNTRNLSVIITMSKANYGTACSFFHAFVRTADRTYTNYHTLISPHNMSSHIMSYCITSHHIISYHITSYQVKHNHHNQTQHNPPH